MRDVIMNREGLELDRENLIEVGVATAKAEILSDIRKGEVPCDVAHFAHLHEFVDANEYGQSDDLYAFLGPDAGCEILNEIQCRLDMWLRIRQSVRLGYETEK